MPLKVLVADDDPTVLATLTKILEERGHTVTPATDGAQAFEQIQNNAPEAAFLGLTMAEMDGYNLLEWIRTHAEMQNMWVGLMTEMADKFRKGDGLPHQPDEWITKPIDPIEAETWSLNHPT